MYTVYVIQNNKNNRYYIGVTSGLIKRLKYHNTGKNRSTKGKGIWRLVCQEKFLDKKSAWLREKQIKSYKGGEAFKKLVNQGGVG